MLSPAGICDGDPDRNADGNTNSHSDSHPYCNACRDAHGSRQPQPQRGLPLPAVDSRRPQRQFGIGLPVTRRQRNRKALNATGAKVRPLHFRP